MEADSLIRLLPAGRGMPRGIKEAHMRGEGGAKKETPSFIDKVPEVIIV